MANIIELKDKNGDIAYPVTLAKSVYLSNNKDTVQKLIDDSEDYNSDIKFEDGTVVKTLASGRKVTTVFTANDITETTTEDDVVIRKKVTTFNADGSISIRLED